MCRWKVTRPVNRVNGTRHMNWLRVARCVRRQRVELLKVVPVVGCGRGRRLRHHSRRPGRVACANTGPVEHWLGGRWWPHHLLGDLELLALLVKAAMHLCG
jgi:hypothetical protein